MAVRTVSFRHACGRSGLRDSVVALHCLEEGAVLVVIAAEGCCHVGGDGDVRIARVKGRHLCACQAFRVDLADALRSVCVVSALVESAHGVKGIKDILDLLGVLSLPVKAHKADACVGRDSLQDSEVVDRCRVVFQSQRRDVAVACTDKFCNQLLIPDREVRDRCRQVEFFEDAAVRERDALDCCAVEINLFDDLAAGQVDGFLVSCPQGRAVSRVDLAEEFVASDRHGVEVGVGIIYICIADFDLLEVCCH